MNTVNQNRNLVPSLLNDLKEEDLVLVTFRTKLGHDRVMGCTQRLGAIPAEAHEGRFAPKLNHESIVCVYDFQNSDWRAFRKDAVISYTVA
jgi:hypothetical protein